MDAVGPQFVWLSLACMVAMPAMVHGQAAAQAPTTDEARCTALTQLDLEAATAGPTRVTSARLLTVPAIGLDENPNRASGFGRRSLESRVKHFCAVTGFVAPQNKFELRLPLAADWNRRFFFAACGGFC